MLNRATRPLGSASNAYICVSCRYRLTNLPKAQARRQSHVTTPTTNSDSWIDNINQISDEFGQGEGRRSTALKEPQTEGRIENNTKHGSPTRRAVKENEKAGRTSTKTTGTKKSEKIASKASQLGDGSISRAKDTSPTSEQLSIAEKVREAKNRAKWGGNSERKQLSGKAKGRPSHDSLRKADKVSAEVVIETAINKRPYGFHEDSAGQKDAQAQDSAQADSPPRKPRNASGRSSPTRREIRERRKAKRLSASSKTAEHSATDPSSSQLSGNAEPADKFRTLEEAMSVDTTPQQTAKEKKPKARKTPDAPKLPRSQNASIETGRIRAGDLDLQPLDIPQPSIPYLEHGLDRVLFSPGVHQLQDPTSRVYNFDPYLQKIMPVQEFDFSSLKQYKTSSEDQALAGLAKQHGKRYIGSTSSMTGCLAHFHYLLSSFRPLNLDMLTKNFNTSSPGNHTFTILSRAPSSIFLRWKNGSYAIDADKEFDSGNVLMLLGKSMELLLTQPRSEYERYRKSDPRSVPEEQKTAPEAYQYTTMGDFLMRSQLDAYDPRLPDNGTFDLKTRAVVSVRMDAQNYEPMTGYELYTLQGKWGSFEREYFDMMRATMLKYMLQARMGRMNGIFVAYHNVKRIFGFQYVPMRDMDLALHGQTDPALGDQEFRVSLELLNRLLDKATAKFPKKSLRIHFETRQHSGELGHLTSLHVFAEPMSEHEVDGIQGKSKTKIEMFERDVMGLAQLPSESEGHSSPSKAPNSGQRDDGSAAAHTHRSDASKQLTDIKSMSSPTTPQNHDTGPAAKEELKPLFYATVLIKSTVNGNFIGEERPENLSRDDKWTVEYLMREYEIGRTEWASYEDTKTRRKKAYMDDEEEDGQTNTDSPKKEDYYIRFLRDMATRGEYLRERIDRSEKDKIPVMVGKPLSRVRESVDGVDEYLKELYKGKELYH